MRKPFYDAIGWQSKKSESDAKKLQLASLLLSHSELALLRHTLQHLKRVSCKGKETGASPAELARAFALVLCPIDKNLEDNVGKKMSQDQQYDLSVCLVEQLIINSKLIGVVPPDINATVNCGIRREDEAVRGRAPARGDQYRRRSRSLSKTLLDSARKVVRGVRERSSSRARAQSAILAKREIAF